jgi:Fe-S-cluster containining protein
MKELYDRSYFFDQGLRFECLRCGNCCKWSPGFVFINKKECARIAQYLGIPAACLVGRYLRPFKEGYYILEKPNGWCPFYDEEAGCTIYSVRPTQCQTFPFWFKILRSKENWHGISRQCPGVGRGCLYSKEQIIKIVQSTFFLLCNCPDHAEPNGHKM